MFDERFEFYYYDPDFCRQAELKGVSCGDWDISLIRESHGSFSSESWSSEYQKYLSKWEDRLFDSPQKIERFKLEFSHF